MAGTRMSTVLFVHGAHLAGWCWLLVMDRLAQSRVRSIAVDLPFTSFEDDVQCVRGAIAAARGRGPVHVVGHSYAGLAIAAGGHQAGHLTFVAGRLPLPGESPSAGTEEWGVPEFRACMETDDHGVVHLSTAARPYLFQRTDASLAELATSRFRPMSSVVPDEPLDDPAWMSVPSSYVVCADDRAVRPDAQRERAALVGASVELDTDHSPFLSDAQALATFVAGQHRVLDAA
jgi:pimeloyl-ACP methyl ester carboxylesterase